MPGTRSHPWFVAYDEFAIWGFGDTPSAARAEARSEIEAGQIDDDEVEAAMEGLRVASATDALYRSENSTNFCTCRASRQDPIVLHVPDKECPLFGDRS